MKKLTRKQKLFSSEYQKDFCATDAAKRAGYSTRSATEIGYQLLQIPAIKEAIEKDTEARLRKVGVTAEKVLTELARVAHCDIRRLYDDQGMLRPPKEWDDDTAAAVAGLEVFEEFIGKGEERMKIGETKKVRTHSKIEALVNLAKHLKLFGDDTLKVQIEPPQYTDAEKAFLKELAIARAKKELEALREAPSGTQEGEQ